MTPEYPSSARRNRGRILDAVERNLLNLDVLAPALGVPVERLTRDAPAGDRRSIVWRFNMRTAFVPRRALGGAEGLLRGNLGNPPMSSGPKTI
jgi:hypothetical protein